METINKEEHLGVDVRNKYIKRLYSDPEVKLELYNLFVFPKKRANCIFF